MWPAPLQKNAPTIIRYMREALVLIPAHHPHALPAPHSLGVPSARVPALIAKVFPAPEDHNHGGLDQEINADIEVQAEDIPSAEDTNPPLSVIHFTRHPVGYVLYGSEFTLERPVFLALFWSGGNITPSSKACFEPWQGSKEF